MSTGSQGQQQLATAAQQLPLLDRYGYRYDISLSHPRVTAIRMEEAPDNIAFSSSQQDDIATSSPFTPLLQLWTYHRCDQPDAGPSHLESKLSRPPYPNSFRFVSFKMTLFSKYLCTRLFQNRRVNLYVIK